MCVCLLDLDVSRLEHGHMHGPSRRHSTLRLLSRPASLDAGVCVCGGTWHLLVVFLVRDERRHFWRHARLLACMSLGWGRGGHTDWPPKVFVCALVCVWLAVCCVTVPGVCRGRGDWLGSTGRCSRFYGCFEGRDQSSPLLKGLATPQVQLLWWPLRGGMGWLRRPVDTPVVVQRG